MTSIGMVNNTCRCLNRAGPKTASGYDCCAFGTQFDGTNDDLRRTSQFSGAVDSSQVIIAAGFYVTASVASDSLVTISTNGLNPALVISFNGANQLSISVTNKPSLNNYSIRTNTAFIPSIPPSYTTLLCSIDTNFSAGNKLGHLYINDVSDAGLIGDASPAFNIDWTQNRFTHCIGATLSAASRASVIMTGLYIHQGAYMDFSVEANRRFFFTPDRTPTCNWLTSNNGTYASGSQPTICLIDAYSTYNNNYGSGGTITVTGALTGGVSPCDTVTGFDFGGGEEL